MSQKKEELLQDSFKKDLNNRLLPVALDDEGGPKVRRGPATLFHQFQLSCPQRCGRRQVLFEHSTVKPFHQFCRSQIVDLPETRNNTLRARVHEATCQTN